MRAVICSEVGSLDNVGVRDVPQPEVGTGQIRVAVRCAGVSYLDGLIATGRYQFPVPTPYVPGSESAGVIDAVGLGVDSWQVGDRAVSLSGTGAFAEYVLAEEHQLLRIPDNLDFPQAASFVQSYETAWYALTRRAKVAEGETVLITGAGGGAGLAAVDVAKSLGARVIATGSSDAKRDLALTAGADDVVDSAVDDLKSLIRSMTAGRGVDVVYDTVGGALSEPALRALAFDGRFCVVGFPGGISKVPLNLVLLNNRTVLGIETHGWAMQFESEKVALLDEILGAIRSGDLHPTVPTIRPLTDAAVIMADLLERRAAGKTVLSMDA
jgi:NADPH2:quinone reductase